MAVSVLFRTPEDRLPTDRVTEPGFFADLNFDQIVAAITQDKEEYDVAPFFSMPLHDPDAVAYRHEVLKDLEDPKLRRCVETFAEALHDIRGLLAHLDQDYYEQQKQRWHLDAAAAYVHAVNVFADELAAAHPRSRALLALTKHLQTYLRSHAFRQLSQETQTLKANLAGIRYEVLIEGLRVELRGYENEPNYSSEIQRLFKRFSQESLGDYDYHFRDSTSMTQVEGRILDLVSQLQSDVFTRLATFHETHKNFMDETITRFDREVQFYLSYLAYISPLQARKLRFCYPEVSKTDKAVSSQGCFDLALAHTLAETQASPVTNDFYLKGPERILVVSGPNQGGKTTFSRTFGQLHYLASLGLPTPGRQNRLYLPDTILTHFEKEEKMTNLRGKLEDDLVRMHRILQAATPRSIILINEIFTSTTLQDAIALSQKIAQAIMKLDALCVWVTFIDEISNVSEKTVSMVSEVNPAQPAVRTFKIARKPADGLAYALSIAEKYELTSKQILRRIKP